MIADVAGQLLKWHRQKSERKEDMYVCDCLSKLVSWELFECVSKVCGKCPVSLRLTLKTRKQSNNYMWIYEHVLFCLISNFSEILILWCTLLILFSALKSKGFVSMLWYLSVDQIRFRLNKSPSFSLHWLKMQNICICGSRDSCVCVSYVSWPQYTEQTLWTGSVLAGGLLPAKYSLFLFF